MSTVENEDVGWELAVEKPPTYIHTDSDGTPPVPLVKKYFVLMLLFTLGGLLVLFSLGYSGL